MNRIHVNSMRRKIRLCANFELTEIVADLIKEWERWPRCIFFDIKHKILKGLFIPENLVADLVILSRSKTLYQYPTHYSLKSKLKLLEAGIPDSNIEISVATQVSDQVRGKNYGTIKDSLRKLSYIGTSISLNELEILMHDIYDEYQVAKIKEKLIAPLDMELDTDSTVYTEKLISRVDLKLFEAVERAMLTLSEYNRKPSDRWRDWSTL